VTGVVGSRTEIRASSMIFGPDDRASPSTGSHAIGDPNDYY
jgi:hypothetical protein